MREIKGVVAPGWLVADGSDRLAHERKMGRAMVTSVVIHGAFLTALLLALAVPKEVLNSLKPAAEMIFLSTPDPGPGGGGGGNPAPAPPKRMEVPQHAAPAIAPEPVAAPPDPLPELLAPVQTNNSGLLQATGSRTISLSPWGGGGRGPGLGPGDGRGPGPGSVAGYGDGAFAPGNGVTWPISIFEAKPVFTAEGMRKKIQGDVVLEVVVLADGSVGPVRVIKSLDRESGMDDAAIENAKKWRFRPGTKDGKPVATLIQMTVTFRLH